MLLYGDLMSLTAELLSVMKKEGYHPKLIAVIDKAVLHELESWDVEDTKEIHVYMEGEPGLFVGVMVDVLQCWNRAQSVMESVEMWHERIGQRVYRTGVYEHGHGQ